MADDEFAAKFPPGTKVVAPLASGDSVEGYVRYVGEVPFASGVHVGLELCAPVGDCDGTVDGVTLFSTQPLCGLFVRAFNVTKSTGSVRSAGSVGSARSVGLARSVDNGALQAKATWSITEDTSLVATRARLGIGDRVRTNGMDGTVGYIGRPEFASADHPVWVGVELDAPIQIKSHYARMDTGHFWSISDNDGSIMGVRYMDTDPGKALFAIPSKVRRLLASGEEEKTPEEIEAERRALINSAHVVRYVRKKRPSSGKTRRAQQRERLRDVIHSTQRRQRRLSDELLNIKAKELLARAMASNENIVAPLRKTQATRTARKRMDAKRMQSARDAKRRKRLLASQNMS